jgi:hypothetical protein
LLSQLGISIFCSALKGIVSFDRGELWETVAQKFHHLGEPYTDASLRKAILEAVSHLEWISITELTQLLSQVKEGIPHG